MTQQAASPRPQRTPMSQAQKEARATQRAKDEHVHVFAVAGRPGVFTTKSKSDPTERHTLVVDGTQVHCSCKGYEYHRVCKHQQALVSRLAREAVAAARQPQPSAAVPDRVRAKASDLYAD